VFLSARLGVSACRERIFGRFDYCRAAFHFPAHRLISCIEWRDPSPFRVIFIFSFNCCQYTSFRCQYVIMYCHRLLGAAFLVGFSLVWVVFPLSLDTSSTSQYVILTY
jgi:hypothetical protein